MAERSAGIGGSAASGWQWTKARPSPSFLETAALHSGGAERREGKWRFFREDRFGGREHGVGASGRDCAASAVWASRGVREALAGGQGDRGRRDGRGVGPVQSPERAHALDRPQGNRVLSFVSDTAVVVVGVVVDIGGGV